MKYIKCLLLLFMLTGCTRVNMPEKLDKEEEKRENEQTVSCISEDGQELLIFAKGDEIQKLQQSFVISFDDAGIKEDMDKEEALSNIKASIDEKYKDINGVNVEGSLTDNGVLIQVMIDYTVADMDDLIANGFIEEGEKESQYISLKKSIASYTEKGYACELQ